MTFALLDPTVSKAHLSSRLFVNASRSSSFCFNQLELGYCLFEI